MKDTWRQLFRRLAAGCIIFGSMAWSSAVCYAITLANDTASDPIYASGWTAGQNGGTGFSAWDFDSGYFWPYNQVFYDYAGKPNAHRIDNSNPFNNIGQSWNILRKPDTEGVARAGRGFPTLQAGQTLSVVVDTPAQLPPFNGGFWVKLIGNTGTTTTAGTHGNVCLNDRACYFVPDPARPGKWKSGASPITQAAVHNWNYEGGFGFGYGKVFVSDANPANGADRDTFTGLFNFDTTPPDTSTSNGGIRVDVTMTSATDFNLSITRLSNPGSPAFTQSGQIRNTTNTQGQPIGIDWIQFDHVGNLSDAGTPSAADFNGDGKVDLADYVTLRKGGTTNDYFPFREEFGNAGSTPSVGTDFYIRSLTITSSSSALGLGGVPEPGTFVYLVTAAAGGMGLVRRRRS